MNIQKENNERSIRSWADFSYDLLHKIFSLVHVGDKAVFLSVCKSWNSILMNMTRHDENNNPKCPSPYLMFNNKFFHPIYENYQQLDDIADTSDLMVHIAKGDWLLVSRRVRHAFINVYFLNLFTKEEITLPSYPGSFLFSAYFSSPPTSTKGLVFGVGITEQAFVIRTFRYGDEDWTSCTFDSRNFEYLSDSECLYSYCNAVRYKRMYYFLCRSATLVIHDPKRSKSYLYEAPEFISQDFSSVHDQQYMLEVDGKLLAVFTSDDGSWVRVCRWNIREKRWEVVESLGNKMLFVSRVSSTYETATARGLGNKIYFPRFIGDHCLFYSLDTKKYHTFKPGPSYRTFHGSISYPYSAWIKPSFCFQIDDK